MAKRKGLNKRRLGKCYELAGYKFILDEKYKTAKNARLVHGTIQGDGFPPNPHAWVRYDAELGKMKDGDREVDFGDIEMVWEPVGDNDFPASYFKWQYRAVEHYAYTLDEAREKIVSEGHWGPWDGDYHDVEWERDARGRRRLKKVVARGHSKEEYAS